MLSLDEGRPPVPPADLMLRVVGSFEVGDIDAARHAFDVEGLNNLRFFEHALAAISKWHFGDGVWLGDERVAIQRSFRDFDRLLDFGCGCGRFLRHLGSIADDVEVHGIDIDPEMIEWVRSNIPFGSYALAPHEPPLPYPDHHFDLVISHSVFTHLPERLQDLWLAELRRVTRPDALLLLTVQGQSTWARTKATAREQAPSWQKQLEERGILFIDQDAFVGSTHPDFYHSTIHAPWYVFEHWAQFFDIDAYLPDGSWSQDLVVLRRRDDGAGSSATPIGRRHALSEFASTPRATLSRLNARAQRLRARRTTAREPALETNRELAMLRAGLEEQARRISVLAAQLREEIDQVRRGRHDGSP